MLDGEYAQTAESRWAPWLSLNTTSSSAAGNSPGLDGLQLRPSRIFLTFISFPYNLFTRVFLSLTSNRRLCYSHRLPCVFQSHQKRLVRLKGLSTQLLCTDQLNPDPSQARHHKSRSLLLHPSTAICPPTTANCLAQLYNLHF